MSDVPVDPAHGLEPDAYCRLVEAHLCRKNDGHLIRISGPSFDLVRGWAAQGIPLPVALRGIDRTFERYYRKGTRRRPLQVSFCESDVLDSFDEWRRALGLSLSALSGEAADESEHAERTPRAGSLPSHLERVVNRLTLLRGGTHVDPAFDAALEQAVREIDGARPGARALRGEAREALLRRLVALDDELVATARARLAPAQQDELTRQAAAELDPFRERMSPGSYEAALAAAVTRLVRQASGLPVLTHGA